MLRRALLCSALIGVSACGGSSGPDIIPPAFFNLPPVFQGAAMQSLTTEENNSDSLVTISVSDPNSDPISLAISAEGDGSLFVLNASSGSLTFIDPPNFERPDDENMDNVYSVTITATDPSGAQSRQTFEITVTDVTDNPALKRVGTGFDRPLGLIPIPGDTRLAVVEQRGRIRLLDPSDGTVESVDFMTITGLATGNEQGLLGLAFAPDFETSGEFYVNLIPDDVRQTEIRRYSTVSGRRDVGDPATEENIIIVNQPFVNHNAGWIGFSNDGNLIIPMGDGGNAGDPQNNAQNPQVLLGKVLRLDVSADAFPNDPDRNYAIPSGNAFTDMADGLPEIYALGLRNPFQSSLDPVSGDLLIGDVGQLEREEVNRLSLTSGAGTNFGWRIKEGTLDYDVPASGVPANLTPPAAEYGHERTDRGGFSITGGVAYQGKLESLEGQYIFADFVTSNLWALPLEDLGDSAIQPSEFQVLTPDADAGTFANISAFASGLDGTAYVVTLGGDIFEFVAAD